MMDERAKANLFLFLLIFLVSLYTKVLAAGTSMSCDI